MNRDLIEHYQAGSDKLRREVAGLSREQLQARPGPGAWSIQEVIVRSSASDSGDASSGIAAPFRSASLPSSNRAMCRSRKRQTRCSCSIPAPNSPTS